MGTLGTAPAVPRPPARRRCSPRLAVAALPAGSARARRASNRAPSGGRGSAAILLWAQPHRHGSGHGGTEGAAEAAGAGGSPGEGQAEVGAAGAEAAAAGGDLRPEPGDDRAGAAAVRLLLQADAGIRGMTAQRPPCPPSFLAPLVFIIKLSFLYQ